MIVYLVPFILFILFKIFKTKESIIISIISLYCFLLLSFRENVGFDYHQYKYFYINEIVPQELISKIITQFSFLFNDYHMFFLIFAFITILPIWYVSKKLNSSYFLLSYILIPCFFIESFSLIRQSASMSIMILAYYMFKTNNKFYLILMISSILIHQSAFLFFIIFLIFNFSHKHIRIIITLLLFILLINLNIITPYLIQHIPKLEWYLNNTNQFGSTIALIYGIIYLFSAYKTYKYNNLDFFILTFGIILLNILIYIDGVLIRLSYYFLIPLIFAKDTFLPTMRLNTYKVNNMFFLFLMFGLYIGMLIVKSKVEFGPLIPYSTFL